MRYLLFPLACVLASIAAADDSPPFDELPQAEAFAAEPALFPPSQEGRWVKPVAFEQAASASGQPAAESKATSKPATAAAGTAKPKTESLAPAPPSFAKRVAMLEVRLARRVAEQPNLWQFGDIEQDAAGLLADATNDAERQAVRAIATRADRFAALAQRYRTARGGAPALTARTAAAVNPTAAQQPAAPQTRSVASASVVGVGQGKPAGQAAYDAVGELRPVVSKRPGAPKYALVGDDGKVVTFVTPAEGLDLDPLLGKRVGARGGRGFMPEYRHRHLTAQKITPLETLRR